MDKYEGTLARQRAQSAPAVPNPPPGIDEWQYNSAGEPLGLGRGPRDRQGPNAEADGCANGYMATLWISEATLAVSVTTRQRSMLPGAACSRRQGFIQAPSRTRPLR
jgi:hypothetical protein